jgi:hypothetical protein
MPTSNLWLPPMTQDLWPFIRDRLNTPEQATILKGPNRVYVRGQLVLVGGQVVEAELTPQDVESKAWGRLMVIPVEPIGGAVFAEGQPTRLQFLLRTDLNDLKAVSYPIDRDAELSQREAARRLENWDGAGLVSTQIMLVGDFELVRRWQSGVQRDQTAQAGTVYVSSLWAVDAASASD